MIKPDFSSIYNLAAKAHSALPALLASSRALPPMQVSVEVTHKCNLRCEMCYQAARSGGGAELTSAEIKGLIDSLPPWTIITFTGGEPFMRPDFRDILSYALKKHVCNILTNAELLTPADLDLFIDERLSLIGVSIDGLGGTHDTIRRKKGLFDKVTATLRELTAKKKAKGRTFPLLDIKTVILRRNLGELAGLRAMAADIGADYFSLSLTKLSDRQFSEPYFDDLGRDIFQPHKGQPEKLDKAELGKLHEQLDAIMAAKGAPATRFYPRGMLDHAAIDKFYAGQLSGGDFKTCRVPWSLACVSPYGDVFPCLSYRAGNLRAKPMPEIWNGRNFMDFRSRLGRGRLRDCCLGCCYSVYRH